MSIYYPGCADNITDPVCSDCPDKELGDIRSFFLKKVGFDFIDITSPAEWQNAICNKDVYVFPYSQGSLSIAPQETPGFGNVSTDVDSYEYTLSVKEPNYKANWAFWNTIRKSHAYQVGYVTQTQIHLFETPALIEPMAPVAEDKKTKVLWNIIFKMIQENLPQPKDKPTGTFDRCIAC